MKTAANSVGAVAAVAAAGIPEEGSSQLQPAAAAPAAHPKSVVTISIPQQTVLQPGCSYQQALQQMAQVGLQLPVLVKPQVSIATDSCRPAAGDSGGSTAAAAANEISAAAGSASRRTTAASAAAAAAGAVAAGSNDGHTLGMIWSEGGLRDLLGEGPCQQQQQQEEEQQEQGNQQVPPVQHQKQQQEVVKHTQQLTATEQQQCQQMDAAGSQQQQQQQQQDPSPVIPLPAVLQQYVPHEALYKVRCRVMP